MQAALSDPGLNTQNSIRLVSAVCSVLSSLPVKDLMQPLQSLVQCRIQSLQDLAAMEAEPAVRDQVKKELDILSALCHHIYPTLLDGEQHPVSGCGQYITSCEWVWLTHNIL